MNKSLQLGLGLLLLSSTSAFAQDDAPALLITRAKLFDPVELRLLEGYDVLVVGDRFSEIGPSGQVSAPPKARRLDLDGLTLLPGLIDLHSHLLLHPYDETPWDDQVLKESLELRTIRAVVAAGRTLQAGFTTLRDLGTEGAGFADVALRDAIHQGIIPGPRIFTTTRAIVATGCYGPSGFDPRWDVPKGAQVVDGVDGVRRAVREQIATGADWIKVYADYSRRAGEMPTPTFSQEELDALVYEARTADRPVAVHATVDEAIRRAVLAGVATIEHGYHASDEILALMHEKGVVLCPTLAAAEAMARYDGWKPGAEDPRRIRESKEMFKRALIASERLDRPRARLVRKRPTGGALAALRSCYGQTSQRGGVRGRDTDRSHAHDSIPAPIEWGLPEWNPWVPAGPQILFRQGPPPRPKPSVV